MNKILLFVIVVAFGVSGCLQEPMFIPPYAPLAATCPPGEIEWVKFSDFTKDFPIYFNSLADITPQPPPENGEEPKFQDIQTYIMVWHEAFQLNKVIAVYVEKNKHISIKTYEISPGKITEIDFTNDFSSEEIIGALLKFYLCDNTLYVELPTGGEMIIPPNSEFENNG